MAELPYLTTPGTVDSGLEKVKSASEPAELTTTNVGDLLGLKGGNGAAFVRLLRQLRLIGDGGKPTDLYRRFRGEGSRSTALGEGIRHAYAPLFQRVEAAQTLTKDKLVPMITEITGAASDAPKVDLTASTFLRLVKHAEFSPRVEPKETPSAAPETNPMPAHDSTKGAVAKKGSLVLAHNIHLNLPDTTDIRVFNAIFASLRDNLLS